MVTMPLAGSMMDKRGPGKILLVGVTLIAAEWASSPTGWPDRRRTCRHCSSD
ncbi:emrB efflux domain protein [Mycobacterium kansasii 824]|nr:emrB efflux domain protein [Mycobacterium kansasii 824]